MGMTICCRDINKCSKLKFVHTSVHGVGHDFVQSAFQAFSFSPPLAVPEQKDPDPEFPTVKYPNPEEGKGVLVRIFTLFYVSQTSNILYFSKNVRRAPGTFWPKIQWVIFLFCWIICMAGNDWLWLAMPGSVNPQSSMAHPWGTPSSAQQRNGLIYMDQSGPKIFTYMYIS